VYDKMSKNVFYFNCWYRVHVILGRCNAFPMPFPYLIHTLSIHYPCSSLYFIRFMQKVDNLSKFPRFIVNDVKVTHWRIFFTMRWHTERAACKCVYVFVTEWFMKTITKWFALILKKGNFIYRKIYFFFEKVWILLT